MKTSPVLALSALVLALPLLAGCSSGAASSGSHGGSSAGSGSASSGSSSGGSTGGSAATGKQCLDSAETASLLLGTTVTVTETSGSCSYTGDGVAAHSIFTKHSSAAQYAADVAALKADVGSGVVPITGIGDKAEGVMTPKDEVIAYAGGMEVEIVGADYGNQNTDFVNSSGLANSIFAKAILAG